MEQKSSIKICFLLQRRFAYVGHELAVILKEKYGVEKFCGYVYLRSSYEFLKKQREIDYTSLLLDEDIHKQYKSEPLDLVFLEKLEKEYGLPCLWPYIANDRVIISNQLVREYPYDQSPYAHEEIMKILQVKAKAIIDFLETEKPDVIFATVIGGIGSMLLYQIAKKKNIKVLLGIETRINQGYTLTEDYRNFSYAENLFEYLKKNHQISAKLVEAKEYFKNFNKRQTNYLYYSVHDQNKNYRLKPLAWIWPKNLWRSLNWLIKTCCLYFSGQRNDYSDETPLGYLSDRVKRKLRTLKGFDYLYDEIKPQEDFAFFPLHMEPEVAVSLLAPFWTDQINLIRQIAKSLPLHYKLYVKEHPAMVGYRTQAYYKELKKIPNLKLINHNVSSAELVKQTKLLITLTGTVGWEAILLKKPVITFGDVFYNKLSFVKKCEKIEELPYLVKSQLENFNYNEEELELFIAAMLEESADVGLLRIWEKGDESEETKKKKLTLLADLIAQKVGLRPINC